MSPTGPDAKSKSPTDCSAEKDHRGLHHAGQVEGFVEVAFGRAPFADVRQHDSILTPEAQPPRKAGRVRQLSPDGDLAGQDLDSIRDPGWGDFAEVLCRDDLQRKTVVDGRHQLAVLRNHPIPHWIHRHGGADDRSLLTSSGRVDAELALPLERDHAFVVQAGFHHPPQRRDQELLIHKGLNTGHAGSLRSQY